MRRKGEAINVAADARLTRSTISTGPRQLFERNALGKRTLDYELATSNRAADGKKEEQKKADGYNKCKREFRAVHAAAAARKMLMAAAFPIFPATRQRSRSAFKPATRFCTRASIDMRTL
jgi:hypothetical protein